METYQKSGITTDYYGECFEMFDECIKGFSEPFRKKKKIKPIRKFFMMFITVW